ncbi:hypothetical protein BKG91_03565 [Rodentibacter caecimuris]|uniref:Uncharacterized protein n=1 Tax=Rodentibacter caecimuris TaxID=1796644 RepID=A0AAJ3K342_9PAST|nr:hypothetical protein [Rodentibacter heylii]AOF54280.1 hypothetical protein AC062_2193 [Pasteurellaceae bacterium NI1060]MCQ9122889.1 hypothetical protein [Rodentibacter heylii]OOF70038.1 hypothetical protein BKG90_11190 [Rodentibacter heylii]OOF75407.1 hypothetical protein BKG91_03565 [Rodentibacter heylii]OOF76262.1 hypothetical protein BKG99_06625 [Rodentibacter heylii]
MDKYGIHLFGKNFSMTDEKLLVCVHDIDVSGQLTQGWWDLPNTDILNTNDYSEDEVLVFANRHFITYFEGVRQASWGGSKHTGVFGYYRPIIRKKDGHFQIRIRSNFPFANNHDWEGVKLKDPYFYGLNDRANLQKARLRLKIVVPLKKINDIPQYGIAVYDENGNCKYCNATKGYAKRLRVHNLGLSSFSRNDSNHYAQEFRNKTQTITLGNNEFMLISPVGYYDMCYPTPGNRGYFDAGEILPTISEKGMVSITLVSEFYVESRKKRTFPSQASDYYTNYSIINPLVLIAEF